MPPLQFNRGSFARVESCPGGPLPGWKVVPPRKMQGARRTLFGDGPLGEALQASPKIAFPGPSNLTQYMEKNNKFFTWTNVTEPDQLHVAGTNHNMHC